MPWERIEISREELHGKVWSEPMSRLAKEYGLSDVGLSKICTKLKVPKPPQGYWARKRRSQPPPLPHSDGQTVYQLSKWVTDASEQEPSPNPERDSQVALERLPENQIKVDEVLPSDLNPLVARTLKALQKGKSTDPNSWVRAGGKCLDVCVSRQNVDRAMRIMDALVKALEKRKYKISFPEGKPVITVMGEVFHFNLEEPSNRVDHQPTPEEKKQQQEHYWMRPPKWDYFPSGKLSLRIDKGSYGSLRTFNDGKKKRVEECLNAFMIGLIEGAYGKKAAREERERQEKERQEREKLRWKMEELIRAEKKRVEELEKEVTSWHQSQRIRSYVEAVQKMAMERDGSIFPDSELGKWIFWATQQADRLDPLKESPYSVLDEERKYSFW